MARDEASFAQVIISKQGMAEKSVMSPDKLCSLPWRVFSSLVGLKRRGRTRTLGIQKSDSQKDCFQKKRALKNLVTIISPKVTDWGEQNRRK